MLSLAWQTAAAAALRRFLARPPISREVRDQRGYLIAGLLQALVFVLRELVRSRPAPRAAAPRVRQTRF